MVAAPPAHAACVGPAITAVVDSHGTLVVEGEWFGTDCYDTGPPPEGQGVLGPPAKDITVAVRQEGVEYVVARGDASADYTFHVEVEQPPMVGRAVVEARYGAEEGFSSQLLATAEITLAEPDDAASGTTVASFGEPATDATADVSGTAAADGDDSSTDVVPVVVALAGGLVLGVVGTLTWSRTRRAGVSRS